MNDDQFQIEFERLVKLLKDYNIKVDFIAEPDRFAYDFITNELFARETDLVPGKGMFTNFIYEEFHPDHKQEITDLTYHLLNDFFERKLSIDSDYISKELVEPDGNVLSKEELIKRFYAMYEVCIQFANNSFSIENVDFEFKDPEDISSGMGFSEGEINYTIIFKGGERKEIRGLFKIYFTREWDCWSICFFYLAGYNLHAEPKI